jgi:hypothetical protein
VINERVENVGVYTGDTVAHVIKSHENTQPCAFTLVDLRPLKSWPNLKINMFTMLLIILILYNRNCDEQVGEFGYVPSIFVFKPLPVVVKSISAVILCSAVNLYSFL